MAEESGKCCNIFSLPQLPPSWFLFILFLMKLSTGILLFADIITDALTLETYYKRGFIEVFYLSIICIVLPSILIAYLEYKFLRKAYGKSLSMKNILLRTLLNVPFQLTMIWYHLKLSYTYLLRWLNHIKGRDMSTSATYLDSSNKNVDEEERRKHFLMNLNEADNYSRSNELSKPFSDSVLTLDVDGKDNWWKDLTKEQWKSHLVKMNFLESMLESIPQLLIAIYVIAYDYDNVYTIQYLSASVSFLSLCGGVVSYEKNRKDLEADRWMVDKTLLHSRVFYTRLELPQLVCIALYKGCFFASRILALVFFALFFSWAVMVPVILHWGTVFCFYVYKWYSDVDKVTRQLRQADYRYRAYLFLSHDFVSVLYASLAGIFIHVRPYYHTFLDQPYCYMFWYYLAYVSENVILILAPGLVLHPEVIDSVVKYRGNYYAVMFVDILLNIVGSVMCAYYYFGVHKMRAFTSHSYPLASQLLCCCCLHYKSSCVMEGDSTWLPDENSEWTVCKHADTSELFHVKKSAVERFMQTYDTIARNDRQRGRAIECFIDDRCRFFYAPRSKLYKVKQDHPSYSETLPRPSRLRVIDRELVEKEDLKMYNDPEVDGSKLENNGLAVIDVTADDENRSNDELIDPYAVYIKPKESSEVLPDLSDGEDDDSIAQIEASLSAQSTKLVFKKDPLPSSSSHYIQQPPVAPPRRNKKSSVNEGRSESPIYTRVNKARKNKSRPPPPPPVVQPEASLPRSDVSSLESSGPRIPVRPSRSIDMYNEKRSSNSSYHESTLPEYSDGDSVVVAASGVRHDAHLTAEDGDSRDDSDWAQSWV